MQNKLSVSNILMILSIIITFVSFNFNDILFFGMNTFFLDKGDYYHYIIQFFTYNFIHGSLMHLLSNLFFLYIFGNIVENMLGKNKFTTFFIFITILNGIGLTYFTSNQNIIGISGFGLALLTYYTLELKSQKNPEYTGGITAIIINLVIGFIPGISLLGHLFGVIGGILFWFINKNYQKKWIKLG